jgi:nucleotide sugar dehydrogenase
VSELKIGIVGLGMVGNPLRRLLETQRRFFLKKRFKRGENLFLDDINPGLCCCDNVNQADIIFVCVPTPTDLDNGGECDISIVEEVVERIADGKTIVIKSTIPPGTTALFQEKYPKKYFLFCPEFLTEANAWNDFKKPSRQFIGVAGGNGSEIMEVIGKLKRLLPKPIHGKTEVITSTEAELIKYLSNIFGYLKVVFGNMILDFADAISEGAGHGSVRADYFEVMKGVGSDPRIGLSWLDAIHGGYRGAGGYCFPKDMNAFIADQEKLLRRLLLSITRDRCTRLLSEALNVLKAFRQYNRILLEIYGLNEERVSKHDVEFAKTMEAGRS